MNKSALMTAYNAARALDIDRPRLNRALGICQRKEYTSDYTTTESTCTCPDFTYRHTRCKHILSTVLARIAKEG